jgi:ATP-dependent helicase/nuclease subunit A
MMSFPRPPDQEQRNQAVDPRHSVLVRAPAGSGKTGVLLLRYLHCLLSVDQPEKVVAITFTNKAAGEIKERVLKALQAGAKFLRGEESAEPDNGFDHDIRQAVLKVLAHDEAKHWSLLENSARLRITTFDSFCGSLVRRLPLLSGLGAAVPVTDAEALYREAILSLFRQMDEKNCPPALAEALQKLLAYGSNRIETLLPLLSNLLSKRDQWLRDVLGGDLDAMEAALAEEVAAQFEPAWASLQDLQIEQLLQALIESSGGNVDHAWAADLRAANAMDLDDFALLQTLASTMLTGKGELYKPGSLNYAGLKAKAPGNAQAKAWLKGLQDDGLFEEASQNLATLAGLPPPFFPASSRELIGHFRVALVHLLAHLRLAFEQRGGVDFGEIAQRAIVALRAENGEAVGEALLLEDRVQHILVDEMQDTSVSQIDLLTALCQGWEDDDGRSVFFCGDLQQSIYAFRGSLVSLFDELQQRGSFAGKTLMPLQLRANFRSSPDLVNWVNNCFQRMFTERGHDYVAALPQRSNDGVVCVHPQVLAQGVSAKAGAGQNEAQNIVTLIQQVHRDNSDASIAILIRSRSQLKFIVPALKSAALAFSGQDIDGLSSTPAVMDLMALLRALWHEADDVSWAAVLRAPFVGLSWDDLLSLREAAGLLRDAIMDIELAASLSAQGQLALSHLRDCIQYLEARPESRDLRWALRSAWHLLGGPACIEAHQQADIDRVFALLNDYAPAGLLEDIAALERALSKLYAAPPSSKIELMTIHKSKGLEFDVVILPGLGSAGRNADRDLLAWQWLRGHMIFAPKPQHSSSADDSAAEKLYDYMSASQRRALDEEVDRLVYVALTRAKRELHLFGVTQINSKGDLGPSSGSILARIWHDVEADFERAEVLEQDDAVAPRQVPLAARLQDFGVEITPLWQPPLPPQSPLQRAQRQTEHAVLEDNIEDRAVGIVFHELMERLGRRNDRAVWADDSQRLRLGITQRLRHHCHPEPGLEDSVNRVMALVNNTLACPKGQWILDSYQWQGSEQTIRRMLGGQWQTLILDRVFIENERCWIVDYKTASSRGGLVPFFASQAERYSAKMQIYAQALRATGVECAISTALYFPAHQHLLVLDENAAALDQ